MTTSEKRPSTPDGGVEHWAVVEGAQGGLWRAYCAGCGFKSERANRGTARSWAELHNSVYAAASGPSSTEQEQP